MPLTEVQHRIAQALRTTPPHHHESPTLGLVQLLPTQLETAVHVRSIIARYGGALLADNVGSGKTFVALAVARHYQSVHIVAPATLLSMWRDAVQRTSTTTPTPEQARPPKRPQVQVHSLHQFSRRRHARLASNTNTLVVIDEAHQLRHANTARYRALAHAVTGAHTLLLSATPLHNTASELQTLCALFTRQVQPEMIVRQSTPSMPESGSTQGRVHRPTIVEHRIRPIPQNEETLAKILTLPAPLPTRDGAAAGAFIRLGLLRAWCSSDAALAGALRRRQLRGQALRDALHAGRHPTAEELRSWVIGESDGQLAFPELLVTHAVEAMPLLLTLEHHLQAITALTHHHGLTSTGDTVRAQRLREIMHRHADVPIIAFSQFERTVIAMYRALADIAGVGMLTSSNGRIASGPIQREELLGFFAPTAQGRPPPPPHQAVRLLITTDLLAEGVNLQDAGVVVHLDLPWTHALLTQRVGRCARLGSPHQAVHVYRLRSSAHATSALRAEARIAQKASLARRHVAGTRAQPSPPEISARLREAIDAWDRATTASWQECPSVAFSVCWRRDTRRTTQALALLHPPDASHPRLLVVRPGGSPPVLSGSHTLLATIRAISGSEEGAVSRAAVAPEYERVHRCLTRWVDRQTAAASLGVTPHRLWDIDRNQATPTQTRALRLLHRALAQLTVTERTREAPHIVRIQSTIETLRGAGMEAALAAWCARAPTLSPSTTAEVRQWLAGWERDPLLRQAAPTTSRRDNDSDHHPDHHPDHTGSVASDRYRLVAMILILPINLRT